MYRIELPPFYIFTINLSSLVLILPKSTLTSQCLDLTLRHQKNMDTKSDALLWNMIIFLYNCVQEYRTYIHLNAWSAQSLFRKTAFPHFQWIYIVCYWNLKQHSFNHKFLTFITVRQEPHRSLVCIGFSKISTGYLQLGMYRWCP